MAGKECAGRRGRGGPAGLGLPAPSSHHPDLPWNICAFPLCEGQGLAQCSSRNLHVHCPCGL